MIGTRRQAVLRRELRALVPAIPLADAEAIDVAASQARLKALPPSVALWLALVAHIRHAHTEYDRLRDDGYARDEARYFVRGDIDDVLTQWGSSRQLADMMQDDHAEVDEA
jgi:hypothetical protein